MAMKTEEHLRSAMGCILDAHDRYHVPDYEDTEQFLASKFYVMIYGGKSVLGMEAMMRVAEVLNTTFRIVSTCADALEEHVDQLGFYCAAFNNVFRPLNEDARNSSETEFEARYMRFMDMSVATLCEEGLPEDQKIRVVTAAVCFGAASFLEDTIQAFVDMDAE